MPNLIAMAPFSFSNQIFLAKIIRQFALLCGLEGPRLTSHGFLFLIDAMRHAPCFAKPRDDS